MAKIIVVGGGPSGMMAAYQAKKNNENDEVILLDSNNILGKKLLLSGNGRCNVSVNVDDTEFIKGIVKNGKFLYSAMSQISISDIHNFFIKNDVLLKEEDHLRLFPKSEKAKDVVNMFEKLLLKQKVIIKLNHQVSDLNLVESWIIVNDEKIYYDHLVLATGGISYKETGSSGLIHKLLKKNGVGITKLLPQEVSLISEDEAITSKALQGLSFKDVKLSIIEKNKKKKTITHDLIITHFGLSGPCALRSSYEIVKKLQDSDEVIVSIDFIEESNLPKRLLKYLSEHELDLHDFRLKIIATKSIDVAFVTNGGIEIKEIDPKDMKLKKYPNVSVCGELIDISGYTGGYNITSSLISGYVAGSTI
ncbi:MAG: aminoacetone oxidase family FAD-binding enzyme [Anaerorhabdus sp.]